MAKIKKGQHYLHYKFNKLNVNGKESLRLKSVDKHITLLKFSFKNNMQLPDDSSSVNSLLVFKISQILLYFAVFHWLYICVIKHDKTEPEAFRAGRLLELLNGSLRQINVSNT